jgi:hypothetical protein
MSKWKKMDKDLLKGLAIVAAVIAVLAVAFVLGSRSGPQKADCIARALRSGVEYANIGKTCRLSERQY